ncbi:DUF58 domain-containing protein [Halobacillus locisalis]|uniref:DUF58 domain-containing protein n=1 Tax=Halobacillus locisalis TaxID=220753 RepID=A0A838CT79_9BACI|nr:DUF58 domain-containing protein [Halobacillus locisalis]MBA2174975.1 DUF58 domain-containing protein [Halobacillus locisalis]
MTKSFKTLWDLFLFRDRGIVPTTRLVAAFSVVSLVTISLSISGLSWAAIMAINVGIGIVSLLDLLLSPKKNQLHIHRYINEELERGVETEATIEVMNDSKEEAFFRIIDELPPSFSHPFPIKESVSAGQKKTLTYPLTPEERGDYPLEQLHIRYRSKIGLWQKQHKVHLTDHVRVIPDMTSSRQYLEDAQKYLLHEGKRIKKHQQGTGEFSKIRNYVVGDDLRLINWRQTAKLQELMTNEYEPEHGKFVTIIIDCGRMMGVELETGNRLDRTLEAAVTVATAALKKGDAVSVVAFSKGLHVYVPPAKGMDHVRTILRQIYNLKASKVESNYAALFQHLEKVQKKRSLLLLFSDVDALVHEEAHLFYLQRLRRKHVFLMLGIEDQTTVQKAEVTPRTSKQAMVKTMAQKHLMEKEKELGKWERQGLQMVEAPEDQLAATAVSRYIDLMNRGLL